MILVITLFALLASYFIANGMSRTQAEVNIERDRHTLQALQEAKSALIAYAASRAWTIPDDSAHPENDQPGALPCPALIVADDDTNATYGFAGTSCTASPSNPSTRIGLFPWKTIGTSKLSDASGTVLWYALSANFRKDSSTITVNGNPINKTIINSDTPGSLNVNDVSGNTIASNVVAVIIAPGVALNRQNRSPPSVAAYLESTAATVANPNATLTDTFVTAQSSETYNDRLVVVTQADLMAVVEPAVAARIERDIKPYLQTYLTQWGAFPFPAVFASPNPGTSGTSTTRAQSKYVGDTTQSSGLLPITNDSITTDGTPNYNSYSWVSGSGNVTLPPGAIASSISNVTCTTSSSNWRCTFTINSLNSVAICGSAVNRYCIKTPSFNATGQIGTNAGISFATLPNVATVTLTVRSGSHASCIATQSTNAISGTLTNTGLGTVNYTGTLTLSSYQSSSFSCIMRVTIPVVVTSPLINSSSADTGWFIKNEWYRQTYYAVSGDPADGRLVNGMPVYRGVLPGGVGVCGATGSTCLTVNNLPPNATPNDKTGILIFAGRALTGSRPSTNLNDYLEGENQTPSDRIFVHRYKTPAGVTPVITSNDHVVVIAP